MRATGPVDVGTGRPSMLIDAFVAEANFVNEHHVDIDAAPADVWEVVRDAPANLRPTGVAAVIGTVLLRAAELARGEGWRPGSLWPRSLPSGPEVGRLIGSRAAGLRVVEVAEGREIVLAGAHAYATYAVNLFVEALPDGGTRVHNVTRALFLGSLPARTYFAGVRLFHDPLIDWGLANLRHLAEERTMAASRIR